MECMVCFESMSSWNKYNMKGCTHSICIECASRMSTTDTLSHSTYDMSDDMSDDSYFDFDFVPMEPYVPIVIDGRIGFPNEPLPNRLYPSKRVYRENGYVQIYYIYLDGDTNTLKCPYCRQHEPTQYNLDRFRLYWQANTLEWNILERKLHETNEFTMKSNGNTFAFKKSSDDKRVYIIWSHLYLYPNLKKIQIPMKSMPMKSMPMKSIPFRNPRTYQRKNYKQIR